MSEQTLHRWRNQYGGMYAGGAKKLKELERGQRIERITDLMNEVAQQAAR